MKPEPDQSKSNLVDKAATKIVNNTLPDEWEKFDIKPDIFCDYHIETRRKDTLTGKRIYVQQKGEERVKTDGKTAKYAKLKMKHIRYWVKKCRAPVFLFVVDVTTKKVWWLFLQKHFLKDNRSWWVANREKKGKTTVHIPIDQTLDKVQSFHEAIEDSLEFMKELRPGSVKAAARAEKRQLEKSDPRFRVTVTVNDKGTVNYALAARNEPVPMAMVFKGGEEQQKNFLKNGIGRGLKIEFQPGELEILGSPIFDPKKRGSIVNIQVGNVLTEDVIAITNRDGTTYELRFKDTQVVAGLEEANMTCNLCDELAEFRGVVTHTGIGVSISFDLNKFSGHPISQLPYFDQIKAIVANTLDGQTPDFYLDRNGNRTYAGKCPPPSVEDRNGWEGMKVYCAFLTDLRKLCQRLRVDFMLPHVITEDEFENVAKVIDQLREGTTPMPKVNGTMGLEVFDDGLAQRLKNGETVLFDRIDFQMPKEGAVILGQKVELPPLRRSFTKVNVAVTEDIGNNRFEATFASTENTEHMMQIEIPAVPPSSQS